MVKISFLVTHFTFTGANQWFSLSSIGLSKRDLLGKSTLTTVDRKCRRRQLEKGKLTQLKCVCVCV